MALIEAVTIQPVGPDAAAEGLALTVEANWNQTAEDWAFFISYGTVFGARDAAGRLVATAAVLAYSARFAWISLVIVARSQRGGGLGTQMLKECLATLRSRGLTGMLDATMAATKMYARLGFQPLFRLSRWEGVGGRPSAHREHVRPLAASSIDGIAALDAASLGVSREKLLADYWSRAGTRAFALEGASGFALVRRGRVAAHVGPVVAPDERDALALIETAVAATSGAIFLDVPDAWAGIAAWLDAHHFTVQRPFVRMTLGPDIPHSDPGRLFATAGPEYG
jgi:GNAT superfamily N-acetyltransferase